MHESRDKKIIQTTYNRAASAHGGTTNSHTPLMPEYEDMLARVEHDLPQGARALDLGCGDAHRFTQRLAAHFLVTGVDFSEGQLAEARKLLPEATFLCQDMMTLESEPESFHFILCLYALFHVPLKEQRHLIHRIAEWLAPGGYVALLFNNRDTGGIDVEEAWCGGPMRWFHYSRDDYQRMLAEVGLQEVMSFTEDDAEPEAWRVALYRK
jgi:SAM-dependent methyltransferase